MGKIARDPSNCLRSPYYEYLRYGLLVALPVHETKIMGQMLSRWCGDRRDERGGIAALCGSIWAQLCGQLPSGTYGHQAVARVEIAKPNGGVRKLGVPTVVPRRARPI